MIDDPRLIAIDGPAGSGKSTVAQELARRLGWLYIDTGAMYRAVTSAVIERGEDPSDARASSRIAEEVRIELVPSGEGLRVVMDGEDVTERIRSMRVTGSVSRIASHSGVRRAMVRRQREMGLASGGAVMEGRDIGSVVFPGARWKFFMDASPEERARRRYGDFRIRGEDPDLDEILKEIKRRDLEDSTRADSPLICPDDAEVIDTTGLSIEDVVALILSRVRDGGVEIR